MSGSSRSLLSRFGLSLSCAFRILFEQKFAEKVASLGAEQEPVEALPAPSSPPAPTPVAPTSNAALQLLSLLQREGRFIDFVQQEIAAFSDADIGAAARLVHEGCRRALHQHGRIVSVRSETEGAALTLERASDDVKLVGNVTGSAPFRGVLRHRGWRVENFELPKLIGTHDPKLVAPAELELP